ncbi:MAG: hypothetical protein K8F92_20410 [Hyphomicrobium sp.]|uniref:hypothetical protein n=1 Tax=Hyphomicrobium sp. TaxID=82 RepID=UPI001326EA3D|nr:hypothetical protein [Hyphomicrobium sp.]KAB2941349.1 MAG: hypothetical protein F9K20_09600 [Hyphomicrobium sp.]MBZ0211997.1 hypothetical protein [Hyphomicrobium sp.]
MKFANVAGMRRTPVRPFWDLSGVQPNGDRQKRRCAGAASGHTTAWWEDESEWHCCWKNAFEAQSVIGVVGDVMRRPLMSMVTNVIWQAGALFACVRSAQWSVPPSSSSSALARGHAMGWSLAERREGEGIGREDDTGKVWRDGYGNLSSRQFFGMLAWGNAIAASCVSCISSSAIAIMPLIVLPS